MTKIENNNVYYYHNDHLGTPLLMTSSSGSTVWQGEFKPFGESVSVSGSITNNLRFPGQYYDSETDLHYNYFRDYKAEIGRYVEADPIGLDKGRNHLFFYVKNSPVNLIDFFGLKWKFLWWYEDYGYWNILSLKIKIDTTLYAVCQESCTYEIKKVFAAYESLWDKTPTEPKSVIDSLFNIIEDIRRAKKEGCSKIEAVKSEGGQRICDTLN